MPLTRLRRRSKVILGAAALVAATVGAGAYAYVNYVSVDRYTSGHGQVTVESNPVDGHGPVLVTDKGFALYMFPPDGASRVSCTGDCAFAWPPLLVPGGGTVVAGEGVRAGLLGTMPNPDGGGRVVTYHGWPLYTYLGDAGPGTATGQGVNADGGYWYLMRPSGAIVSN